MNLFDHAREASIRKEQPLAARMRPRTLQEYVGQEHILAPGRLLHRAIQADRISSLIFYGPPGTGKTTLASVIANTTKSDFVVLNAVLSGVKDIRDVTEKAQRIRGEYERRTILFVDEVHRWNKAQQDALLPWVENGTVILIGATTENPYFTVNRALVSRSRIFQLRPLEPFHLRRIAESAIADEERGYGKLNVSVDEDALAHLVDVANGDARGILNALELAVETTPPDADGRIVITMAVAEESIQRRAVLYDKEGDYHFDTISAFIKSLRGSDPDAALYWMARMVYAGEDPRFLFRRMLIFCGEDIGLADPNALVVTEAAAAAFERVGLPEGQYHLGMAVLYLATAPKSNSVMGFFDAISAVEKEKESEVPNHLKDASRDKEGFGHGVGYLYPHAFRDHWVAQQYLPDGLQGKVFYTPGTIGFESGIADDVMRRREAQLAAAVDENAVGAPPEILTFSPADRSLDRWLSRTISGFGERLAEIRDRMFKAIGISRHSVVLVLNADTGLLAWECLRRTPEGGVYVLASTPEASEALREQVQKLPDMRRPVILVGKPENLAEVLADAGSGDVRFDAVVGRNLLTSRDNKMNLIRAWKERLSPGGCLCLAEAIPAKTQRLYEYLTDERGSLEELFGRWKDAEERIYADPADPMVNWNEHDLEKWFTGNGLAEVRVEHIPYATQQIITENLLERWLEPGRRGNRPSYVSHLKQSLSDAEVTEIGRLLRTRLSGKTVAWNSIAAIVSGKMEETVH